MATAWGLYRTEFLFLTSDTAPDEEAQYQAYRKTIELLDGRPCTIRTLDLGADKWTQATLQEPERNPFLGLRSIRFSLQNQPMFKTQLRAILRASAHGPMHLMFPLVSTLMELRQARLILRDVMEELDEEGIPHDRRPKVGIMIEVPSAALMARTFAAEADFFSIGTNDLVQYTLAVDRGNERVASLYTAASPAVLQLVKNVIRAGRHAGIDASLCGEIAGDPVFTMLLLGHGVAYTLHGPGADPRGETRGANRGHRTLRTTGPTGWLVRLGAADPYDAARRVAETGPRELWRLGLRPEPRGNRNSAPHACGGRPRNDPARCGPRHARVTAEQLRMTRTASNLCTPGTPRVPCLHGPGGSRIR